MVSCHYMFGVHQMLRLQGNVHFTYMVDMHGMAEQTQSAATTGEHGLPKDWGPWNNRFVGGKLGFWVHVFWSLSRNSGVWESTFWVVMQEDGPNKHTLVGHWPGSGVQIWKVPAGSKPLFLPMAPNQGRCSPSPLRTEKNGPSTFPSTFVVRILSPSCFPSCFSSCFRCFPSCFLAVLGVFQAVWPRALRRGGGNSLEQLFAKQASGKNSRTETLTEW